MPEVYGGYGGVSHKAQKMYVGVNGVSKEVQKMYVGVNGLSVLVYPSNVPSTYLQQFFVMSSSTTFTVNKLL